MEDIPGGPKLPRTPQGPQSVGARSGARTPAPSPQEAAAESPGISFAPGSQASMQIAASSLSIPYRYFGQLTGDYFIHSASIVRLPLLAKLG